MTEETVIDRVVFGELLASVSGDRQFLGELIDTYLADGVAQLAHMRRSLAAHDLDSFRRAAHSLKSSSASFGASDLAGQSRELEMLARAGSLDGAAEKVVCVEEAWKQVSIELGRLRTAA
jgi:HPt (histidine-containing phosphotransfer) domain-containing protein